MDATVGETVNFLVNGVATGGVVLKRVGARVYVRNASVRSWIEVRDLLSRDDVAHGTFAMFLRSKGNDIYADHEDFNSMPPSKRDEIMAAFAQASYVDITTTRSFPHEWTFSAKVGTFSASVVTIEWRGPLGPPIPPNPTLAASRWQRVSYSDHTDAGVMCL